MRTRWMVLAALSLFLVPSLTQPARAAAPATKGAGGGNATIAVFDLDGPMGESPAAADPFMLGQPPSSLRDLAKRMREAGEDANVKAVVVLADGMMAGPGQVEELRQMLARL